jgi:hypothetical protein
MQISNTWARPLVGAPVIRTALAAMVILGAYAFPEPAAAQKTDVVTLINGDQITGEIKELVLGKLRWSTDAAGTIYIEWPEVASLLTDKFLEIQFTTGPRVFGSIEPGEDGLLAIVQPDQRVEVPLESVVSIAAMGGLISVGYSLEKANVTSTFTTDGDVSYRAPSFDISVSGSAYSQTRTDANRTLRYNVNLNGQWRFADRWGVVGLTGLERSDEIELDLRATYAIGASYILTENQQVRLLWVAGIGANSEQFVGEPRFNSVEHIQAMDLQWFMFGDNETSLSTRLTVQPNLTDFGRVRIDFDTRFRRELFLDFFVALSGFDRFDSRPPSATVETASTNDYGLNFSIGYDF